MNIPKTMKAGVLYGYKNLTLQEIPVPEPKENEILLKVGACGICGSDIRYYYGENAWALHTLGFNEPTPGAAILGHEVAGTITQLGTHSSEWQEGDRVGALAFKSCVCASFVYGISQICALFNTISAMMVAGKRWIMHLEGTVNICRFGRIKFSLCQNMFHLLRLPSSMVWRLRFMQ